MDSEVSQAKHALLIEDYEDHSDRFSLTLEENGYEVDCAYDKTKAIDKLTEVVYDLILMDIMLPELDDGLELLDMITGDSINAKTSVIMISIRDDSQAINRAGSRASVFLVKPVYDEQLVRAIRKVESEHQK